MGKNRSTIYKRIFLTNTVIVIFLIGALDIYFIKDLVRNTRETNYYISEKIVRDVNDELNKIYDYSIQLVRELYRDHFLISDVIDFLNMDTLSYLKQKMNKIYESDSFYYRGIESFTNESFLQNENLKEISFISFIRNEKSLFNRLNQINVKELQSGEFYKDGKILKLIGDRGTISFVQEIRDPSNLQIIGLMVLKYDLNYLKYIDKKYEEKANILILDDQNYVVYDSRGVLDYIPVSDYENIIKDRNHYIDSTFSDGGLKVILMVKPQDFEKMLDSILALVIMGSILLIISQGINYFKLKVLSDRTDNILESMDKVKNGELDVEITLTHEDDEINYIAESFNEMCKDLKKYIDRSYKAEIERKKSEMKALQSQINPHFLYNTLESIRMKSICNGDKEVGRMLYILSVLFRNQLKDKNIISLESELDYCRKYIEIFKFRYYDNFQFFIEYDEELLNNQIIKFTLQPLVENYFVHGIRLEDKDNVLKIKILREEEDVIIKIIDNGKGIDDVKLNYLNNSLKNRSYEGSSIGIFNVHERIVIEYGKNYGVSFIKTKDKENLVIVRIPRKGV